MKRTLLLLSLVLPGFSSLFSQNCNNLDFESGNFNNWTGATGTVSTGPSTPPYQPIYNWSSLTINSTTPNAPTSSTAQHTLLTTNGLDPNCYDPATGQQASCMTLIAPGGGGISVRLGNDNVNYGAERLRYTIAVTPSNPNFSYSYAVVLEDPNHLPQEQPRFEINTYDQNGVQIPGACGQYVVYAGSDPAFISNPSSAPNPYVKYKCWTTVGVDLTPYVGQNVTVEFVTSDCTLGGHFGYAYIDLSCAQLQASVGFCQGDTNQLLIAPPGFVGYQWYDPSNNPIPGATNDSLMITNGNVGDQYTVVLTSISGCQATMVTTLAYSQISNTFITTPTCFGGSTGTISVSSTGGSLPYTYQWSDGQTTQTATSLSAGTYTVTVQSGSCVQTDTVQVTSDPLPAATSSQVHYCQGDPAIAVAPAGYPYHQWYTPAGAAIPAPNGTMDTLLITSPVDGQVYVDSMRTADGCYYPFTIQVRDTVINTTVSGTNNPCFFDTIGVANVSVTGGVQPYTYLWSTGATTSSINNLGPGTYIVTVNSGACQEVDTVVITSPAAPQDPENSFTFCYGDPSLVLSTPFAGAGYNYQWFQENSSNPIPGEYSDTLLVLNPVAGNMYLVLITPPTGCPVMDTIVLDYGAPSLPDYMLKNNVFTPNGDGKNDRYEVFFPYTKTFHIEIYNRWGVKVYESDNFNQGEGWDGKIDGKDADEGVYYWMATYTSRCDEQEKTYESRGFVHLLR